MPSIRRQIIVAQVVVLIAGALIGSVYGHFERGLLIAALLLLAWHLRQLLTFERALREKDFGSFRYADGIWSRLYSQFSYQRGQSKQYKKNYRQLVKEVRKSTNAMPDGGIVLTKDFEIVSCNKVAKKLVGFRRRKDRGQRVDNLIRDPAFGAYLASGNFADGVEIRSPIQDGGWLQCRLVPYGSDQFLLIIQDVTERNHLAVVRREFVANASHELRSPLTVVSGYLDTLSSEEEIPEHWRRPIEQMQTQAKRMNKIVAELLELSRLEGAGTAPVDEVVDVCGLLSAVEKSMQGRDDAAKINVECKTHSQLRGSSAEIESVIVNLVSNAIRHTPKDGSIDLSWFDREDGGAELAVSDSGIGIEEEFIPRLTERFFRVDAGRSRDDGGVGLGLAIVKYVLESHGAHLDITSEPQIGSTFSCVFPAERTVTTDSA